MKIIADENIPYVKEVFAHLGKVQTLSGRAMTCDVVADADCLLVRSITQVNEKLLSGSTVRFVATATIGYDHVDIDYLKSKGIDFSSAPGSNAVSVADYILSTLFTLAQKKGFCLKGKSIGIIGAGNVGSRVALRAEALGLNVKLNDPPLAESTHDPKYLPIEALMDCDILTLHVPLTRQGCCPTYRMIDAAFLEKTRQGLVFLNSSRGEVVEEAALKKYIKQGHFSAVALDVWENEPAIDPELLSLVDLGTPHIAGYSFDGKVRGTEMIYRAAAAFFGIAPEWHLTLPLPPVPEFRIPETLQDGEAALSYAVLSLYSVLRDSEPLKKSLLLAECERRAFFDTLRKEYPVRREFANTRLLVGARTPEWTAMFQKIGFSVQS
ncbi:MAG: hypothetical protein A2293_10830 [Elusimicrobia bacterium RIFOXYB2_FULL_49_7]|nr:MAG: hypothetical protein A2293_10830 [Elusimicrobia bacterium RIFOXYB2_FULL_49_7]